MIDVREKVNIKENTTKEKSTVKESGLSVTYAKKNSNKIGLLLCHSHIELRLRFR